MKNSDIIKLEAVGEFPFTFYIEKAVPMQDGEEMILEGIASTTNIDHDKERMSKDALQSMEAAINRNGVPLRVEHDKEDSAIIGMVYEARVDERDQLHIKTRLDEKHPISRRLYDSLKKGAKMGFSVGGLVKRAVQEFSEAAGGMIKTFYDVALQEVSVTQRPANYDSWLIAKSIAKDEEEAKSYHERTDLQNRFFFENPRLDYLKAFAKSIPDKAWRKVESPVINKEEKSMNDKEEKKESEETEKSVTRSEFNSLMKTVSEGFDKISNFLSKAMDGDAMDANNPNKKKPDDESPTVKTEGDGARDQEQPDEKKPKDESSTAKSEDEETETKKTETETEEEKKKSSKEDDIYSLETVNRSIKSLDNLHKRLVGMKKTESETEEEKNKSEADGTKDTDRETEDEKPEKEDSETRKSAHPLDLFVAKMTAVVEAMADNISKSGHRVLGLESEFISKAILNNPEVQAEIAKAMKVPGLKKSVVMGVPYMVTKEGKRVALTAPVEKVEKSEQPKDFKSLYKSNYSSLQGDEE